jgi:hypothetical protein
MHDASFAQAFDGRGLTPTKHEAQAARRAIHTIAATLSRLPMWSVDRVAKGGSFAKGTSVRGSFDVDLVVFVNCPHLAAAVPKPLLRGLLAVAAEALLALGAVVDSVGGRTHCDNGSFP